MTYPHQGISTMEDDMSISGISGTPGAVQQWTPVQQGQQQAQAQPATPGQTDPAAAPKKAGGHHHHHGGGAPKAASASTTPASSTTGSTTTANGTTGSVLDILT
jgi:hypothetical protein